SSIIHHLITGPHEPSPQSMVRVLTNHHQNPSSIIISFIIHHHPSFIIHHRSSRTTPSIHGSCPHEPSSEPTNLHHSSVQTLL
ncbi:MAG TPA: hypothetical protein VIS49_00410, partial [Cyclobacteriaceae bacterium]